MTNEQPNLRLTLFAWWAIIQLFAIIGLLVAYQNQKSDAQMWHAEHEKLRHEVYDLEQKLKAAATNGPVEILVADPPRTNFNLTIKRLTEMGDHMDEMNRKLAENNAQMDRIVEKLQYIVVGREIWTSRWSTNR